MWSTVFDKAMRQFVQTGAYELTYADGHTRRYGDPSADPVRVIFHNPDLPRKFLMAPDMTSGESYMNGDMTIEGDDLRGFLTVAMRNRVAGRDPLIMRLGQNILGPLQRWLRANDPRHARRNVAHHYDLSSDLYDLFLDEDRQYSCAYFTDPQMSLDDAQREKKRHIARKLCLSPDMRVLDIGCGWGGMALTLARDHGAQVVGVTLSEEQHRIARDRVRDAGLEDRIDIRLMDYREVEGPFDRIVSVGMFEHVGAAHFREYFDKIGSLLPPDGVALIHTIGTQTPPRATSPWLRRYIFPGGYLPALSEAVEAIEKAHLTITDIEVLRLHYARTLRHWSNRFNANIDKARALFDDRFTRMWNYYLTASELGFIEERLANFQFQIAHRKDAVPLTRDYLYRN